MTTPHAPRRPRPCCLRALAGRAPGENPVDCTGCGAELVPAPDGEGWMIVVPVEVEARPEPRRIPPAAYDGPGYGGRSSLGYGRGFPQGFSPPAAERLQKARARGRKTRGYRVLS